MTADIDIHELQDELWSGAGTGKNGRDIGRIQYAKLLKLGFVPPMKNGSHVNIAVKFLEGLNGKN